MVLQRAPRELVAKPEPQPRPPGSLSKLPPGETWVSLTNHKSLPVIKMS